MLEVTMEQIGEVKGMEMLMMMIPMKSSSMVMTMATISPLREGIPVADSLCHRALFLFVVSTLVAKVELFCDLPCVLGFLED